MEKKVIKITLFFILGVFIPRIIYADQLNEQKDSTLKFIVIGHTYSTIKNSNERDSYIEKINAENPDYVFILGDSDADDPSIYSEYILNIKSKVFFAPGNHDIRASEDSIYQTTVGYLDTTIIEDACNIILFNSLESVQNVNKYLEASLERINSNQPTILFTHHRVWDDNLLSEAPYEHDKSYLFSEILPVIKNKVNYIFAGNSSAQYFSRQYSKKHPIQKDVVFWCDIVEDITCYSIGMKYKKHFSIVEVRNGKVAVYPRFAEDKGDAEKDLEGIKQKNTITKKNTTTKAGKTKKAKENIIISKLKSKSIWAAFLSGIFLTYALVFFLKKDK